MALRTVRLDADTEKVLDEVREATGLPISEAFKLGLRVLRDDVCREAGRVPFEVYRQLDLGPGGTAVAPSTDTRGGVRRALRKKHGR
jgi:hypothetical protein